MTTSARGVVLRTEARLFRREVGSLFWVVLFPVVLLAVLGAVPDLRDPQEELGGQRLVDLYVPVSVLLSVIMAGLLAMPPVVVGYRERGILRRLRTTPVHPASLLGAQVVLHAAAVLASVVLVLAYGRLVLDTPLPRSPVGYAVAFVLAVAAASALGAVVMAVSPTTKASTAVGTVVFFPAMFTAGVWAPVQAMSGLLRDVVGATPLGAASEALHDAMVGDFPRLADLGIMAAWTAVLGLLSVRLFRWE